MRLAKKNSEMHPKILSLENRNRFDEVSLKKSRDDIELNGDDLISIIYIYIFFFVTIRQDVITSN